MATRGRRLNARVAAELRAAHRMHRRRAGGDRVRRRRTLDVKHACGCAIAVAAALCSVACGGPAHGGANGANAAPPEGSGTITVDGTPHELLRLHASTDANADEYVRGKKMVMSAFVDNPDVAVFFDFDDVAAGSAAAVPYGTPDVTVLFDRRDYRALDATVEIVEGSLDEGAPVHVRVAATRFVSDCGDDEKEVAIDMTAPVDRLLPPPDATTAPAAGSIVGTFAVAGEDPVSYIGLVDGTLEPLAAGDAGWMMGSADRCETGALHWQFTFAVPESVGAGDDVPLDAGAIAMRLEQIDTESREVQRTFVATAGTVHADDAVTDDPHGHARMELTGVRMSEADEQGNVVDGGAAVTLDQATLNASIGADLILP
jgi:hypothetical protein